MSTKLLITGASLGSIRGDTCKVWPVDCCGVIGRFVSSIDANLSEESIDGVTWSSWLMWPRTTLRMRSMMMGMMMRMTLLLITTGTIGGRGGGVTGVRAFFVGVWHNCNRLLLTDKSLCHIDFFFLSILFPE